MRDCISEVQQTPTGTRNNTLFDGPINISLLSYLACTGEVFSADTH